jgi:hypothetical protein
MQLRVPEHVAAFPSVCSRVSMSVNTRSRQIPGQNGLGNVTFKTVVRTDIPIDERTRQFKLSVDLRESGSVQYPATHSGAT